MTQDVRIHDLKSRGAALLVTVILVAVAVYLAEERRISRLQPESQNSAANQSATAIQQPPAAGLAEAEREELERFRKNTLELLRLRGQVALLRQERDAQRQQLALSGGVPVGGFVSKEQLVSAGTATPEAALQTFVAAMASGNFDGMLTTMVPNATDGDMATNRASFEKHSQEEGGRFKGMQITAKRVLSDNKVEIQALMFVEGKAPELCIQRMVKSGSEWKFEQSVGDADSWESEGQVQLFTPPQ